MDYFKDHMPQHLYEKLTETHIDEALKEHRPESLKALVDAIMYNMLCEEFGKSNY
jgi:hypothetical protein